ncbi:hypothetical protein [Kangiella koreensis]|uniref:Uncharacterized protein n=1 Tax=Kangiella koreensis (strain DSM 16069 / JCM 12317 / KCTC 12182 / SW-125) TaxID=523791 RepID=C7RAF5_KANKD|nr:hypothetical protein [Kangiella koreensis]ACV28049.1 hypothetical protein Kkor_2641 [Kangiella koreensis DSM 16069]
MKLFIRLFIFLLIAAALAYGYIWYKNKQAIDDIFSQLRMFTSASYDTTFVSIDGKSVTRGIKFTFPGTSTDATIDEFQIGTESLIESFKLVRSIETRMLNDAPSSMVLKVQNFQFPLTLDLESDSSFATEPDFFTKLQMAGCDNKRTISISDLNEMGYNQISLDLNTSINYDHHINQAKFVVYADARDYGSFQIDSLMDNISQNSYNSKLKNITMTIKNDGYVNRLNEFCADLVGVSKEDYYQRHLDYFTHLLYNESIYLSDEFYMQYADYVANPRSIKISTYPDNSMDPFQLMSMSPQLMVSSLNMSITINDHEIRQLFGARPNPEDLPELDEPVQVIDDSIETIQGLTLQETDTSQLANYINYQAYFDYRGKSYKGVIESVEGSVARINTQVSAGNYLQMPFRVSEIRNLQVRREFNGD